MHIGTVYSLGVCSTYCDNRVIVGTVCGVGTGVWNKHCDNRSIVGTVVVVLGL